MRLPINLLLARVSRTAHVTQLGNLRITGTQTEIRVWVIQNTKIPIMPTTAASSFSHGVDQFYFTQGLFLFSLGWRRHLGYDGTDTQNSTFYFCPCLSESRPKTQKVNKFLLSIGGRIV